VRHRVGGRRGQGHSAWSDPTTDNGAKKKYDPAIAKLATTCSGCAIANAPARRAAAESFVDASDGQVYWAPERGGSP